jgi:hypothetical protein
MARVKRPTWFWMASSSGVSRVARTPVVPLQIYRGPGFVNQDGPPVAPAAARWLGDARLCYSEDAMLAGPNVR